MGQELPDMTLALIAMSDFVRDYGLHVLITIMVLLVVRQRLLTKPKLRLAHDKWFLKVPVAGDVSAGRGYSTFCPNPQHSHHQFGTFAGRHEGRQRCTD